MKNDLTQPLQKGFSLLEVLVAIVIFAIGMLALASLQGSLTRASSDANLRTTAANIAERTIEDLRSFRNIDSLDASGAEVGCDAEGALSSYQCIVDQLGDDAIQITDGAIAFDVSFDVTPYYYVAADDEFTYTAPDGIAVSDFKLVEVTVAWSANVGFQQDEDSAPLTNADMGTGEVTLAAIISSVSSQGSGRVVSQDDESTFSPFVNYTPGERPDVIGLALGDNRLKESLTPIPDVISRDELVETNFNVITYSQTGDDSLFLRLESFKSVTCECQLGDEDGNLTGSGRRPTLWAADEYEQGEFVTKVVGSSANNNQSPYCDVCCQDHHDGGTGEKDDANDEGRSLFDPWRPRGSVADGDANDYWQSGTMSGDHEHYGYDNRGDLVLADSAGDHYEESCRMVRVDGFWRVIHDFRQEGLVLFPWDYFNYDDNVTNYSSYVTSGTADLVGNIGENSEYYFNSTLDALAPSTDYLTGADALPTGTDLPTWQNADSQQLRARGIYLDFMSAELREVLGCLAAGNETEACSAGGTEISAGNTIELDAVGSDNYLEAIPFFDVQLTWLARWNETPLNTPVETTNEAVADQNDHSRGLASITGPAGDSVVEAIVHRGNIGFTDTDPIDLRYDDQLSDQYGTDLLAQTKLTVSVDPANPPDPPEGTVEITGTITSGVSGVQASRVDIADTNNASCQRTSTGYTCWITGSNPSMTLSGYNKRNADTAACSDNMVEQQNNDNAADPRAVFNLDSLAVGTAIADILIVGAANCSGL